MAASFEDLISTASLSVHYQKNVVPRDFLDAVADIVPAGLNHLEFALKVVGYLAIHDLWHGVGSIPDGASEPILCTVLRAEMKWNAYRKPDLQGFLSTGLEFISRLDDLLRQYGKIYPELVFTTRELEHPLRNPFVNCHSDLAQTPVFNVVSPVFQRTMREKVLKIKEGQLSEFKVRQTLWNFVKEPLLAAKWITVDMVPDEDTLMGFLPEDLFIIFHQAIRRKILSKNNRLDTEYSNHQKTAIALGIKNIKKFIEKHCGPKVKKPKVTKPRNLIKQAESALYATQQAPDIDDYDDPASVPEFAEDLKKTEEFERLLAEAFEGQLGKDSTKKKSPKTKNRRLSDHYRAGRPVVANRLCSYKLFLQKISLFRLFSMQLKHRGDVRGLFGRGISDFQMNSGWKIEKILDIRVSDDLVEPIILEHPTYYPKLRRLFYPPAQRVGWPKIYREMAEKPQDAPDVIAFWRAHNVIREPLSLLHEIYIPLPFREIWDELSKHDGNRITRNRHLFQLPRKSSPGSFTRENFLNYLKEFNVFLHKNSSGLDDLTEGQIRAFFETAYEYAGLCPEQRYLVSEQIRSIYLVDLWYHRSTVGEYHANYVAAYNLIDLEIQKLLPEIATKCGLPFETNAFPTYEDPDQVRDIFRQTGYSLGAWRCARKDGALAVTEAMRDSFLTPNQRSKIEVHNQFCRLLVVLFEIFWGLRDFEYPRIKNGSIDLEAGYITFQGKGIIDRLPIHPFLGRLLAAYEKTIPEIRKGIRDSQYLFVVDECGTCHDPDIAQFQQILAAGYTLAGVEKPVELYSWRHLFNFLMIACQLPIEVRRYLLRHESSGIERSNSYLNVNQKRFCKEYFRFGNILVKMFHIENLEEKIIALL